MKRYLKYTAAAVSAVTMAASSVPAFAAQVIVNDGSQKAEETVETEETAADTETEQAVVDTETVETAEAAETTETVADTAAEETVGYSTLKGTITAVTVNEDSTARITFQSEERGEIIFNEASDCMVIIDGAVKTLADLKEGMSATIVMDDFAPMTMSLPPQTSGAIAIVVDGETPTTTVVEKFNDELVGGDVKLIIDETVQILDIRGTRQILTADDIKGHKAIVVYGASTKSIPAQTTPYLVVILDNAEETTETTDTTETTETRDADETADTVLPLRATLEEMGYTIEWTSNDAPIVITKDDVNLSVSIDSDTVVVDGDMAYQLSSDVTIVDGVTYIPADLVEHLN